MSVEFDEAVSPGPTRPTARLPFFAGLVMKTGLVKTPGAAQIVILVLAILLIILAVALYRDSNVQAPFPTPEQVAV